MSEKQEKLLFIGAAAVLIICFVLFVWSISVAFACDELMQDESLTAEKVCRPSDAQIAQMFPPPPEYFPPPGALMPVIPPVQQSPRPGYYRNPYPNNCGEECYQEFHRRVRPSLCQQRDGSWRPCR